MTGSIERAAIYLAAGIVAASLIVTFGVMKSVPILGKSFERAGSYAHSSGSSTHIPSSFSVELSKQAPAAKAMTSDDRVRLQSAIKDKIVGATIHEAQVQSFAMTEFTADRDGSLNVECNLSLSDGTALDKVYAHFRPDGFGGYYGFFGTKRNGIDLIRDVHIE